MKKAKSLNLVISVLVIFAIFISPASAIAQSGPAEDHAGGPSKGIEVTLRADRAPSPGGTAQLSIDVTPLINAPKLELRWFAPEGVQMGGNEVDAFQDVTANLPVHSERTLSFPSAGTYKIAVSANLRFAPEMTYGTSGVLFFVIDPLGSRVTDKDPDAGNMQRNNFEQITVSTDSVNITPQAPNDDDPCFTIFAHFDRIDRPLVKDETGFHYGPDIRVPLAGIGVEFRESDLLFDDSYGTLGTDANGNVAGSFCDDDGWFDDTLEIYLRVYAERGDPKVYVEDSSWIDEEYEYDTAEKDSGGGTLNFEIHMGDVWSGIFNIVDIASQTVDFWRSSGGSFSEETEIHWEEGYGDDKSYYDSFWSEITIADDPSDPDQWDEPIFVHEWGHFADDYHSCDDSPGGDHAPGQIIDPELAWGEGYPTYFSSAMRDTYGFPYANWMVDINGSGVPGNQYDLEDINYPVSTQNQGSISAALWDLYDDDLDGQDVVEIGHPTIQAVYLSSEFNDAAYGFWDDTCDFDTYMAGWVDVGAPTDYQTAAVVKENTGYSLPPGSAIAESQAGITSGTEFSPADVYRWWKTLTYVADNSSSMNGPKFEAIKALFVEAVNDLGGDEAGEKGTEFSLELFNNTSPANDIEFAGQFFPERLIEPIDNLTTIPNADACQVNALLALAQAVDDKEKGDVWLFTDGDTTQMPSVENVRQLLNENQMRASMALMGVCSAMAEEQVTKEPFTTEMLQGLTLEEQQSLMAERLLPGQAEATLGPMADEVPGGIVPYLLTAINSGGMFLYVDETQVEDAADILRAQITNSAGAGRWSDYVSDHATYRWDELDWEYEWIDAISFDSRKGNPTDIQDLVIYLPADTYFQYYSGPYYDKVHVFEDGYLNFGLSGAFVPVNGRIPDTDPPNNALFPLWNNMNAYCPPSVNAPQACVGYIYAMQQGDWFAIEYDQYESREPDYALNTFEILLNLDTYEIRYQYQSVPNGGSSATIGLENSNGSAGVEVRYNDVAGASSGMGYKFTPAPPQPTKTYTVTVDSSMQAVGFLLAGYSGSFEPLAITDPDGDPVSCSEAGALCLDLDLVQYVQVNTNGRTGDWHAVVDAGATGEGTFSFISMAASPIAVESDFDHTLNTNAQQLLVHLNGQVDGCQLSGQFHLLNGSSFGDSFNLFDDGLHNDGGSCDGLFGSALFDPPKAGNAYLSLLGHSAGEAFLRIDPVPYAFQPFQVTSLGDGVNYGGATPLQFQFTNHDAYDHCYWITYDAPEGWWTNLGWVPMRCLDAGETADFTFNFYLTSGQTNILPSGTTGVVTLSATELRKGMISDSASARITRHREPYRIEIFNPTHYIGPNGDTAVLEIQVFDIQNVVVVDGTQLQLRSIIGDIDPLIGTTKNGYLRATFTSDEHLGTALIDVKTANDVMASTSIEVIDLLPDKITLQASPNHLPPDGASTSTLVATVRDGQGNPVSNQTVRMGVEGDGQWGTISGGEVITGTTDLNGQFSAILTSGEVVAIVGVRAELLYDQGLGLQAVDEDRIEIYIGSRLYLPLASR
jgi:hypothetical protein